MYWRTAAAAVVSTLVIAPGFYRVPFGELVPDLSAVAAPPLHAEPTVMPSAVSSVLPTPPPPPPPFAPDDPLLGLSLTKTAAGYMYSAPNGGAPLVYLHGMCGHPMHMCPWLRDLAPSGLRMICPAAVQSCGPGAHIWNGSPEARAQTMDRILEAAGQSTERAILVGFSQGGYMSADIMRLRPGKYRAAWIVGADVKLDASTLRRANVERIVLSAGDYDGTAEGLRATARKLEKDGFQARYVSLGKVGHAFPLNADPPPRAVLAWLNDGTDWNEPLRGPSPFPVPLGSRALEVPRAAVPDLIVRQ